MFDMSDYGKEGKSYEQLKAFAEPLLEEMQHSVAEYQKTGLSDSISYMGLANELEQLVGWLCEVAEKMESFESER